MDISSFYHLTENDKVRADLATGLVMAVQATGVLVDADDATLAYATGVLQEQVETFLDCEGVYGDALASVRKGTMTEGEALALVVGKCVEQIALFKQAGLH